PRVLMGVAEDTCMYRSVNTYPNLVDKSLHGSADGFLHEADSLLQAFAIIRAAYVGREAKSLAESKERVGPGRFSHELDRTLRSAFEGRVSRLYVDEGSERIDVFERGGYRSCGKEDVLNLATVQTMLHGGHSFAL